MTALPLLELELATDDPQAAARIRAALAAHPDLVTALGLAKSFIAECEDPILATTKPAMLAIIRKALARAELAETGVSRSVDDRLAQDGCPASHDPPLASDIPTHFRV
ncbi:hypothetical protein PX699_15890 [Sphingobium sp. H39-3-25]|uniref:hypothetical protein n=1 Tax=Sphingobium arseniciresistens TaxID=3030834 RepID=UPI0023B986A1|nr:hypothetical protein [Sphingobium arseniciresistens]